MESRIRSIFLGLLGVVSAVLPAQLLAQSGSDAPQVIEPQVARRDIDVAAIDTEDFEITAFAGLMSIEDFESNAVYGLRLAYHISDSFFTEASYGSTSVGKSSFEKLAGGAPLLSNRDLTYYDLSLGYNLFPGEVFWGSERAWNSSVYVIAGVGSTDFADDNNFTINAGFGIKVLPTDYIAIRLDARDYLFDTEITGEKKSTHNLQGTLSVSWFF